MLHSLSRRWRSAFLISLSLLPLLPLTAKGQIGGTTDIITGTITGPNGEPVNAAQIQVTSIETGISRVKATNEKGQYTLLFPDGGGQYQVTVRRIGLAQQQATVSRVADEDRLIANFTMAAVPTQLSAVVVEAQRRPAQRQDERPTPGSTGRTLSGEALSRLPIDSSDPNAIALLAPGVVAIPGSDTTAGGFSVAGQSPEQNLVTLDGLAFDAGTVPQEAVRNTRVVTSTYDVARGQFTGGLIQTTTRGGTNDVAGSFNYNLRDPRLQWSDEDEEGTGFGQGFTQHQLSGGIGGPLRKDKLFYFLSGQLRHRVNPLQSLTGADALTLERLGTSPDSAARFLSLLNSYGLPSSVAAIPDQQLNDNFSGIARMDWMINPDHSLMLRGNYQGSLQEAFRTRALAVPAYGGEQEGNGGGAALTLSSVLGTFINEARASYSHSDRSGDPYLLMPEGRVRVTSALDEGATGVTTLEFGGNPALPSAGTNTSFEMTDELSLLGVGGHRFKLGGFINYTAFSTATSSNSFGSYTFNSLGDFASNAPTSFTRTLSSREREGGSMATALYLGDTWRRSRALQLTYGVRLEHDWYLDEPAFNPVVEELFSRRTDRLPAEWRMSPRVGFTWTLGLPEPGGAQGPAAAARRGGGAARGGARRGGGFAGDFGPGGAKVTVVRGGIGEFRGRTPTQLFASAIDATGLASGEQQLVCIGSAVPVPNWSGFLSNPESIPSQCLDGTSGSSVSRGVPNVALFSDDFGAPRAWRGSVGVQRRLSQRFGVNVDASFALGANLTGARDLNLREAPAFVLANEDLRPVYAPPETIVPRTGQTSVLASREHPELAQVVEAMSELKSETTQITAGLNGIFSQSMIWNMSYTWMHSRDQTAFAPAASIGGGGGRGGFGFGVGSATTGGDPNEVQWGRSDLERKHSFTGSMSWFARPWIDVTSVIRFSSGQPFSPRVGSDINGDGSRNDRAFIFNPASESDSALQAGMTQLLESAPKRARECLRSQIGQIAARNSCRSGWNTTLDMQMNFRPNFGGTIGRRLNFMVSLVNPLAGLDRMFHGSENLRGWGQPDRPDGTLLYVHGFDPVEKRYIYEVNERFGDTQSARTAIRNPFQIGFQMRLQLGPDRQRDMLMGALRRVGGGAAGAINVRNMIERVAPNPVTEIIAMKDTLALTPHQIASLNLVADTLRMTTDTLAAELQRKVDSLGTNVDVRTVFPTIQPRLQEGRDAYLKAIDSAKLILTADQWAKLPESIRNPSLRRARGPRQNR